MFEHPTGIHKHAAWSDAPQMSVLKYEFSLGIKMAFYRSIQAYQDGK